MARNVNVIVSSSFDGTERNNVPDWLISFNAEWIDDDGETHQREENEYFLLLLNWLRQNHPATAKDAMEDLGFRIARFKYGIDAEVI